MILKEIRLKDFGNYDEAFCLLDDNINILVGDNAQGKSNLLDAIYYAAHVSSSKNQKEKDLIKWGRDSFGISARFLNRMGENEVEILYEGKKEVFLNRCKVEKKKDYIGILSAIIFTPEDLNIVKGDPGTRRSFLDQEVMSTDVDYFLTLNRYRKILEQRNNLLRKAYHNPPSEENMSIWEEQLAITGTHLLQKRLELVDNLKTIAQQIHHSISDGKENLEIQYSSTLDLCGLEKGGDEGLFIEGYKTILKNNRSKDLERGYSTIGPHRDDLELYIDGVSAKKFASQGQQRTLALSLKLSELEFIHQKSGEYPLLLLDDVLSELDRNRKRKLLSVIDNKVQTIITTTDLNDIEEILEAKGKTIRIREGKVT